MHKKRTYFVYPASPKILAYNLPMAPIPMSPIADCLSTGEAGDTSALIDIDMLAPTANVGLRSSSRGELCWFSTAYGSERALRRVLSILSD